jgi:hypothetical protein
MIRVMNKILVPGGPEQRSPFGPYPQPLPKNICVTLPSPEDLTKFCRKWRVRELSIYGHVLESDIPPHVPVEIMVGFRSATGWMKTEFNEMVDQLGALFEHKVLLIERAEVDVSSNPVLRGRVFRSVKTLFLEV